MNCLFVSKIIKYCNGIQWGSDINVNRNWKSDSREINEGDAFVAIRGAKVDGHDFIKQAIKNGAKLLLVENTEFHKLNLTEKIYKNITIVSVDNSVYGLAMIAQYYFNKISPQTVGITGSVGKTTTRELLFSVLKNSYRVHSAIKSFNTLIGCSLTILSMPSDTEILLLEYGTNRPGEIAEMVEYFPPHVAIITSIAPSHLAELNSIEGVLIEKLNICKSEKTKNVIINADDSILFDSLINNDNDFNLSSVGYRDDASLRIGYAQMELVNDFSSLKVEYLHRGKEEIYETTLFGIQNAYNIGFAVVVGKLYKMSYTQIKSSLRKTKNVSGRGVFSKINNELWLLDESYNANPTSMNAAIDNMIDIGVNYGLNLYAVLGGMKELGIGSEKYHEAIFEKISLFKKVYLLGEEWDCMNSPYAHIRHLSTIDDIIKELHEINLSKGVVLIKGSNSYELTRVVKKLEVCKKC